MCPVAEAGLSPACRTAGWAGTDRISLALVVLVHGALVLRGGLLPLEEALFAGTAVAHAAALAFSLLVPPRRWRAVRLPVLAALRAADCVAINAIAEAVRVIEREHREADAAGIVGSFEELLRAVLLLVVSVCALQSLVAGGIGFVLPPLLHLALQAAAVGAVAWRTPSGEWPAAAAAGPDPLLTLPSPCPCAPQRAAPLSTATPTSA